MCTENTYDASFVMDQFCNQHLPSVSGSSDQLFGLEAIKYLACFAELNRRHGCTGLCEC